MVRGDFNARTGKEGEEVRKSDEEGETERRRRSNDIKVNGEGKRLCGFLGE